MTLNNLDIYVFVLLIFSFLLYKYYNIVRWYLNKTLNWIELQCESLTDEQTIMKTVIIRWRTLTLFSGPCELNKNFIVQTQLRSISVLSVLNVIHHMYKQYFTEFSDIFFNFTFNFQTNMKTISGCWIIGIMYCT